MSAFPSLLAVDRSSGAPLSGRVVEVLDAKSGAPVTGTIGGSPAA